MKSWTPSLDMSTIPDQILFAEVGRRRAARRDPANAGRPKTLKPCPHCREQMGARDLRAHRPICPKRAG